MSTHNKTSRSIEIYTESATSSTINIHGDLETSNDLIKSDSSASPNLYLKEQDKAISNNCNKYTIPKEIKLSHIESIWQYKPALSNEERRTRHVACEKRRRALVKQQYDHLSKIVPNLNNKRFPKVILLERSIEYLESLVNSNLKLEKELENLKVKLRRDNISKSKSKSTSN